MEIPKYLDQALKRRTRYAQLLIGAGNVVDDYILAHHLEDKIDTSCFLTGCEIYVNPLAAENAVRRAFLDDETVV